MKRVCKNVDIESRELITKAVLECLRPSKKRRRADTRKLFAGLLHISTGKARRALNERGPLYIEGVEKVVDMLQARIKSRRLNLRPVYQQMRVDPGSRKRRKISILSIEQLLLDHVAVVGLAELSRRVGEYQVSSIPKRGAAYGKRAVERWIAKKSCKYACKLDVRDFYGSVDRPKLLLWLHAHVKNRALLWLIGQLVYSVPQGIAIGSFLSQTLANIYLSDLYHQAMERSRSKRGSRQVQHALFYMDDMLFIGPNRRQLRFAILAIISRAADMGLRIKQGWQVFKVEVCRPIDMMGYRFSANRTTLRKRIFKSARRVILRARRAMNRGRGIGARRAARLSSFNGYTTSTDCHAFLSRIGATYIFDAAFKLISNRTKQWKKHDTQASRSQSCSKGTRAIFA